MATMPLHRTTGGFETTPVTDRARQGAVSASVWNALAAIDWRYKKWGSLMLGCRWMDYDYDNGKSGPEKYGYDASQSGVIGALGFYF